MKGIKLFLRIYTGLILISLICIPSYAAKIGDVTEVGWGTQAIRFLSLQDPTIRIALLGAILLGIGCGLLGSFMVVRQKALFGDTLSHAVLPGVVIGFLWNMEKDPMNLFIGATLSGFIGLYVITVLKKTTLLKEDSLMGLVLTGFYALGICLLTMVQNIPTGHQSGLDKFLFGQASSLSWGDIKLMSIVTGLSIVTVGLFYKELLVNSFDVEFAHSTGLNKYFINDILMVLVTATIVISIKAVGIVLVSAMLIIPAATAVLLTNRLNKVIFLAIGIGLISAILGAFISFIAHNLPTGPFMVISGSVIFITAFLFAPEKGLFPRWWRHHGKSVH